MTLGIGTADVSGTPLLNFSSLAQATARFDTTQSFTESNMTQVAVTAVAQFSPATPDLYLFPWIASIGSPTGTGSYEVYGYSMEIIRL
jgi:hypothetical protein